MPALELMQETGKVLAWRKKEGEQVVKGEPLLEIETDKAVVEVEAPGEGILAGITAPEGAVIPVGQTIAWLVLPGEAVPAAGAPAAVPGPARAEAARPAVAAAESSAPAAGGGARISPKARRMAREHGIDIAQVRGSGADGEILASDIQALVDAKGAPAAAPVAAGGTEALGIIGRLMAERTTQSWTSVPHFFVVREVDAGALVDAHKKLRESVEKARGVKPTQTDMLVALVARALAKHPRMNASWTGAAIRLNPDVNMAVAMAVNDGVVAAVIPKADSLDLGEIAVQRRDLTERARAGRSRPADIAGGTFTISNLGMFNVDSFTAIINPPQAAILAVGRIADRVVPVDGKPAIRPMMTLTLSSDHRVVDGARAAAFMNDVVEALREPEKWLR
ncbi:MAG: 2-oxo acid dehydrogenase subunit E2 [Acidobacteriia bacterium]|nr:2-oxo acid dehydrogenase subunit E2 [Terriglobia bacterium]